MENPELNPTTETKQTKSPLVKFITTVILIAVLVFFGWSATKLVKSFPESFDSLASIANKVYNYKTTEEPDSTSTSPETLSNLTVAADRSTMETGERLSIWWTTLPATGNFTFSFRCQDGVTVAVQPDSANEFSDITCGDKYDIGLVDRVEILVTSTKNRFTDLDYTISYFPKDEVVASANNNLAVTIVNPNLSSSDSLSNNTNNNYEPEKDEVVENPSTPEEIPTENGSATETTKPSEETSIPSTPTSKPTYTWQVPVSNPNGYIDLTVSGLNLGFNDRFSNFINTGVINRNERGVIKFTVKNTGTKTSNNWTFSALLPGGISYQSPTQLPLKPQERATFTVQFDAIDKLSIETFSVTVKTTGDLDSNNNELAQSVLVR